MVDRCNFVKVSIVMSSRSCSTWTLASCDATKTQSRLGVHTRQILAVKAITGEDSMDKGIGSIFAGKFWGNHATNLKFTSDGVCHGRVEHPGALVARCRGEKQRDEGILNSSVVAWYLDAVETGK